MVDEDADSCLAVVDLRLIDLIYEAISRYKEEVRSMQNKVILLQSDSIGDAADGLGTTILETFLTVLKTEHKLPAAIFCMNRGVLALTSNALASLKLAEIEAAGVPVYACKTCVDHYGIEAELAAGQISGMNTFVELAAKHAVITLG